MAQSILESFKDGEQHIPLEEEKRAMEQLEAQEHSADLFDPETGAPRLQQPDVLKDVAGMMVAKEKMHKPSQATSSPIPLVKDTLTKQVEEILEQDLGDAFEELSPVKKQEFILKGERAAFEIRQLMKKSKVNVRKVFQIIVNWLTFLPGLNRFFVEQEAKIKADKIIALTRQSAI